MWSIGWNRIKFKHSVSRITVDNYMGMKTRKPHTNFIIWECYLNSLDLNIRILRYLFNGGNNECIKTYNVPSLLYTSSHLILMSPFYKWSKEIYKVTWKIVEWGVKSKPSHTGNRDMTQLSCYWQENRCGWNRAFKISCGISYIIIITININFNSWLSL